MRLPENSNLKVLVVKLSSLPYKPRLHAQQMLALRISPPRAARSRSGSFVRSLIKQPAENRFFSRAFRRGGIHIKSRAQFMTVVLISRISSSLHFVDFVGRLPSDHVPWTPFVRAYFAYLRLDCRKIAGGVIFFVYFLFQIGGWCFCMPKKKILYFFYERKYG
ncbi:hypothetical protein GGR55DRAFT_7403 [Xylaria sp. FL0064]|nr:hypothetical protein GGR55DRAFT_7403 [Xylaria sp. FL0064]